MVWLNTSTPNLPRCGAFLLLVSLRRGCGWQGLAGQGLVWVTTISSRVRSVPGLIGAFADTDWSNISGQYNINTGGVPGALLAASQLTGSFKNGLVCGLLVPDFGYVALPGSF